MIYAPVYPQEAGVVEGLLLRPLVYRYHQASAGPLKCCPPVESSRLALGRRQCPPSSIVSLAEIAEGMCIHLQPLHNTMSSIDIEKI